MNTPPTHRFPTLASNPQSNMTDTSAPSILSRGQFTEKAINDAREEMTDYLINAAEEIQETAEDLEIDHLYDQLGEHLPDNWLDTYELSDSSLFNAAVKCCFDSANSLGCPNAGEKSMIDLYRAGPEWVAETIRRSFAATRTARDSVRDAIKA